MLLFKRLIYIMEEMKYNYIKMNTNLIIKDSRLHLEQTIKHIPSIAIKVCCDQKIFKFANFVWSNKCMRWEKIEQFRIPWPQKELIELQIYQQIKSSLVILGEANIHLQNIASHLNEQIKIPFTYDGLFIGSLYCSISKENQKNKQKTKQHFIFIHKINIVFLENTEAQFFMTIEQNNDIVFKKEFTLQNKKRSHYPNLHLGVKCSDIFTVRLNHPKWVIRDVTFLVDHINRGKTSYYQVWLRNDFKNKIGDLKIEYFLDNLFIQNERQVFSKESILPQIMSPTKTLKQKLQDQESKFEDSTLQAKLQSNRVSKVTEQGPSRFNSQMLQRRGQMKKTLTGKKQKSKHLQLRRPLNLQISNCQQQLF